MKHAVKDDPVQFIRSGVLVESGIFTDTFDAYIRLGNNRFSLKRIVERDHIGVIVMIQMTFVDTLEEVIVTQYKANLLQDGLLLFEHVDYELFEPGLILGKAGFRLI